MIRFENVTKTYKNSTVALRGVSLRFNAGDFVYYPNRPNQRDMRSIGIKRKRASPSERQVI